MDLSNFIPYYPDISDINFDKEMGAKLEFQELLLNPGADYEPDPFFYNYQALLGRWVSPATNNRAIMIRWDPGVGKTRGAFNIALNFMRNSNFKNALFLSGSKIIHTTMRKEVTRYYGYEFKGPKEEETEADISSGKKKKRHGKSTSITRKVKQLGVTPETIVTFMNQLISLPSKKVKKDSSDKSSKKKSTKKQSNISLDESPLQSDNIDIATSTRSIYEETSTRSIYGDMMSSRMRKIKKKKAKGYGDDKEEEKLWTEYLNKPEWRQKARKKYKNHIFIIDEVHQFRATGNRDIKRNYQYVIALLDTIRDICPIVLLTGTPIVDTWVDLFSILSMLYPPNAREIMFDEISAVFGVKSKDIASLAVQYKFPSKDKLDKLSAIIAKYANGLVTDRSSTDVVPKAIPLPDSIDGVDVTNHKYTVIAHDFDDSTWYDYYNKCIDFININNRLPEYTDKQDNMNIGKWLIYQKIDYLSLDNDKKSKLDSLSGFNLNYTESQLSDRNMDQTHIQEYLHLAFMSDYQNEVINAEINKVKQEMPDKEYEKEVVDLYLTRESTNEDPLEKKLNPTSDSKKEAAYNKIRQLYEFVYPKIKIRKSVDYTKELKLSLVDPRLINYINDELNLPISTYDDWYIFDIDTLVYRLIIYKSNRYATNISEIREHMVYIDQDLYDIIGECIEDPNNEIESYIEQGMTQISKNDLIKCLRLLQKPLPPNIMNPTIRSNIETYYKKLDLIYPYTKSEYDFATSDVMIHLESDGLTYSAKMESDIQLDDGTFENIFKIEWETDSNGKRIPNKTRGLGKYSAKYAEVISLLENSEELANKPGYIHTLWVKTGTMNFAAALAKNGWEQYTGRTELKTAGNKPRFAIIHGKTGSDTNIDNIIEAFNLPENRDGSILRLIVGSKKSGVSISFKNTRFFFALSPDFNKTTHIQAQGRVFRADSLTFLPKDERTIYVADIVALPTPTSKKLVEDLQKGLIINKYYPPDPIYINNEPLYYRDLETNDIILDDNDQPIPINLDGTERVGVVPFTTEISMYVVAEQKYSVGAQLMEALKRASIENIILDRMKVGDTDKHNHALLYGQSQINESKAKILNDINEKWYSPANMDNMYLMQAAADMISSRSLATTKYGMLKPVQSIGQFFTGHDGKADNLSMVYDNNFFVLQQNKSYSVKEIENAINEIQSMPTTEYEFFRSISKDNKPDIKIIALELSLSVINIQGKQYQINDPYRSLILNLYKDFWTVFTTRNDKNIVIGGDLIHILYYSVKKNSHLTKLGIKNARNLHTRIAPFITKSGMDIIGTKWTYIDSLDKESIYMTALSRNIMLKEQDVVERAKLMGLEFYLHFSIYSGELLYRQIVGEKGKGSSKQLKPVLLDEPRFINHTCKILNISIQDYYKRISTPAGGYNTARDLYYKSKEYGILIIR